MIALRSTVDEWPAMHSFSDNGRRVGDAVGIFTQVPYASTF